REALTLPARDVRTRTTMTMIEGHEPFIGPRPDHCPVCGSAAPQGGRDLHACPACGHLLWYSSARVGDVTVIRLLDNRVAVMELLDLLDNAVGDGQLGRVVL